MSIQISQPSELLAPYVKQYWAINHQTEAGQSYTQRIVPSGLIELTFYFSHPPKALQERFSISTPSVISGQLNRYYDLEISDELQLFSVTFQPLGAFLFFDFPINEITNQHLSFELLGKKRAAQIEEQLYEAPTFQERIQLMNRFLYRLLCERKPLVDEKRIEASLSMIKHTASSVQVNDLALTSCLSRKQLERKFSTFLGLSPRQYIRIVRFQYALYRKQHAPSQSLTQLALHAGYYDQAHFTNDFKSLTGLSPKQYFKACPPESDYFS